METEKDDVLYRLTRHRSSSPIKDHNGTFIIKDFPVNITFDEDSLLRTGDSTRSLLTPLFASDYDSFCGDNASMEDVSQMLNKKENKENISLPNNHSESSKRLSSASTSPSSSSSSSSSSSKSTSTSLQLLNNSKTENVKSGKSWNDWVIEKTMDDLQKLKLLQKEKKAKISEENVTMKIRIEKEELMRENREKWIKKKTFEHSKKLKEKAAQKEFEHFKEQQQRELIELKSKEKYEEWLKEKSGEREKQKIQKQKRKEKEIDLFEKTLTASQIAYNNWFKKTKTRPKLKRNTYAYSDGSLFSYYDMGCTPPPSYQNPLPWNNLALASSVDTERFSSPPMLWKDVKKREMPRHVNKKPKKIITKHSCVT